MRGFDLSNRATLEVKLKRLVEGESRLVLRGGVGAHERGQTTPGEFKIPKAIIRFGYIRRGHQCGKLNPLTCNFHESNKFAIV
jgi:hypothetical protein